MTHETLQAKLLELVYGELGAREAREVEAHAAGCEPCRAELARLRETRAILSALPPEPAPARGEAALRAAAREAVRRTSRPARAPRWLWSGAALAAALAVVGAVSYRLLALRPGPLGRDDREVLLGRAPEPAAEPAAPGAVESAPPASAPPALAGGERAPDAPPRAAAPAREPRPAAPSRKAAPGPFAAPPPPARPEPLRAEAKAAGRSMDAAAESAEAAEAPRAPAFAAAPRALPGDADAASPAPEREASPAPPASAAAPRGAASPSRARSVAAPPAAPAPGRAAEREPSPDDPVARYAALRAAGALRGEVQAFPGCAGESFRKVERDDAGRVVKYTRRGELGGDRFEAELFYAEDGALAVARWREGSGPWREARLDGAPSPGALPGFAQAPRLAADVEAPPRCAR